MCPKVSIIIPIFNCENYLESCLNSVVNQTIKEIEIILINDGSEDESANIAEKYAQKDNRIRVIHQKNKGAAAARNIGISLAKGRYIGFVDSDDYISSYMYDLLYENSQDSIDLVQCNYVEINTINNEEYHIQHGMGDIGEIERGYIEDNIIPSFASDFNKGFYSLCNKIYRRDFVKENNLIINEEMEVGEDWWFNIECFTKVNNIKFINDELYYYVRQNSQSLMNKYRPKQIEVQLLGRKKIVELLLKYDISKYEIEFNRRFLYSLTSNILMEFTYNKQFNYKKYKDIVTNDLVKDASKDFNSVKNISKICWRLIRNRKYLLSYSIFKQLHNAFYIKNILMSK